MIAELDGCLDGIVAHDATELFQLVHLLADGIASLLQKGNQLLAALSEQLLRQNGTLCIAAQVLEGVRALDEQLVGRLDVARGVVNRNAHPFENLGLIAFLALAQRVVDLLECVRQLVRSDARKLGRVSQLLQGFYRHTGTLRRLVELVSLLDEGAEGGLDCNAETYDGAGYRNDAARCEKCLRRDALECGEKVSHAAASGQNSLKTSPEPVYAVRGVVECVCEVSYSRIPDVVHGAPGVACGAFQIRDSVLQLPDLVQAVLEVD